jgi:uncharacterized protein YecE (DUF72 family)
MGQIRIGCSGWAYPHWRESVYGGAPPRRWLELYSGMLDTVEVNSTFYRLASTSAVERWMEETPPDFLFAVKASRYLTHVRRLAAIRPGVARFYERLGRLPGTPKMGPVLWQLPGDFQRDDDRLEGALEVLPPGRHAFEFRHESWFHPAVYGILERHGAALVIGVHPERPFQALELTADWSFVRLHYGARGRRGNFARTELVTWADRIADWAGAGDVYAYFNNDWEGFAMANARWLARRLSATPESAATGDRLPARR